MIHFTEQHETNQDPSRTDDSPESKRCTPLHHAHSVIMAGAVAPPSQLNNARGAPC